MRITKMFFDSIEQVSDLVQNPIGVEKELADVAHVKDVPYSWNYPELLLDLFYLPRPNVKYPIILEIHGGGFSGGDKKYRRCLCKYLAKNTGAMVINANYGLGEKCPVPIPMQQLAEAINWLVDHKETLHLDLNNFVVTGDSAGAFYACFLAALQDSPELQNLFGIRLKTRITAAVLNCGVYDFNHALSLPGTTIFNQQVCRDLTGQTIEEAKASQYFPGLTIPPHITSKFPPSLVIYSQNDVLCNGQGELLLQRLQETDVPSECICATSPLNNHVFSLVWSSTMAKQTNERIVEFINEQFGNNRSEAQ